MKNEYKINYIAKLFNVKPSTIRYWETEGLIGSERADNNYRMFSKNDIFDIWEIDMYRKMEIPVKQLKKLPDMNINEMNPINSFLFLCACPNFAPETKNNML